MLSATAPQADMSEAGFSETVEQLISRLDHEVAHGDVRAAIAEAVARIRAVPDARLERALVHWRKLGFSRLQVQAPTGIWPPVVNDPFPGLAGVPEIPATELTAEILSGAIQHHGSLLVRGLLDHARAAALCEELDLAFAARDAVRAGAPESDALPWYAEIDLGEQGMIRPSVWDASGMWTADSPRNHARWMDVFETTGLIEVIGGYLGEPPVLSIGKTNLRRVPLVSGTDWHQDGAFLGAEVKALNVWVALSPCGEDAAGLDIMGGRLPYVMQTGTHGALFHWSVGPGLIELLEKGGTPVVSPVFGAGDAMLFDHLMLHRTGMRPGITKQRWASENWFFAPSNYPPGQVPIVI